jgi:hypothetical protein
MSSLQHASLVLSTNNGTSNTNRTSTTWNNINMRTLLGDMYDKYDTYNLCLNTVATATSLNNVYKAPSDSQVMLRIQGLPFINNTYNVGSSYNSNTQYCTIGTFTFGNATITPSINFVGSISAGSVTLTISTTGIILPVGSVITFYDPNLLGLNTKTITAMSATTYTLNSPIGVTAISSIPMYTVANTSASQYFYGSNITTFGKNQELCNITIDYLRLTDLAQPETSGNNFFPNVTFIFDIIGIEKDKGNENGTRINF